MAVTINNIAGTTKISASREIINNNFNEIANKLNPLLNSFNVINGIISLNIPSGTNEIFAKKITLSNSGLVLTSGAGISISNADISSTIGNIILQKGFLKLNEGDVTILKGNIKLQDGIIDDNQNLLSLNFDTTNPALTTNIDTTNLKRNLSIKVVGNALSLPVNTFPTAFLNFTTNLTFAFELFIINVNTSTTSINIDFASNLIGFALPPTTQKIRIQPGGSIHLKYMDTDSITNVKKMFIFGGHNYTII